MQFARLSIYVLSIVCLLLFSAVGKADELARLKYNNPDLVVDLGVGLWAWPVPCDADGDGDFDLIVSCPDKPFNGIWLFENADRRHGQAEVPGVQATAATQPDRALRAAQLCGRRVAGALTQH